MRILAALASSAALAVGLGLNDGAAGMAVGLLRPGRRRQCRLILMFGVFEFTMPAIGMVLGGLLSARFGIWANLLGAAALMILGVQTWRSPGSGSGEASGRDSALAFANTIDNLAAGFGFGSMGLPWYIVCGIVMIVGMAMVSCGLAIGGSAGHRSRAHARWTSGALLAGLGAVKIAQVLHLP